MKNLKKTRILEKIQKFPLTVRKIILWTIVIIMGIILVLIWSKIFLKSFEGLSRKNLFEEIEVPSLKEKIKEAMPEIVIPKIPESIDSQQNE